MNDNKRDGNRFERDFCDLLSQYGFWVHNMAQNQSGQPADVIAVRDRLACLIDCKVCHGRFALSRMRDDPQVVVQVNDNSEKVDIEDIKKRYLTDSPPTTIETTAEDKIEKTEE